MRLAVIGLASSHVDQIVRLASTGRLGPARIGALWAPVVEPVPADRSTQLRRAAGLPDHHGPRSSDHHEPRAAGPPDDHEPRSADHGAPDPLRAALAHGCDAAIVATRDPRSHRTLAAPLLATGLPVFVDKPFVAAPADAEALVAVAERSGALLTSSSALRWHPSVQQASHRWARSAVDSAEGITVRVCGPVDPGSPHGGRAFLGVHAVEAALGALAPRASAEAPRVLRVSDRGDRRVAEIAVGADRAVIELGPFDGWRISGPGVDAALPLDDEYLRPGLLGFVHAVTAGQGAWPLTGAELVDTARVLAEVCG